LLDNYLKICVDVQKKRKRPFYFVDLYCGDGICECEKPRDKWDGSPLISAKWAFKSQYPFFCIFNDIDPTKFDNLKINLQNYMDCIKGIFSDDANKIYTNILKIIPKNEHSLFFLDPQTHTQLYWTTVKNISDHTQDDWYGNPFVRRPELLINLMTYTMQRDYKQNPKYIDGFYGNKNWRETIKECEVKGIPVHIGFLKAYVTQLQEIYSQNPFFVEVRQVGRGLKLEKAATIYYLIFVTSHPKASEIFESLTKYVDKYRKIKWAKDFFKLKGYSSIEEFCKI